jgi:SET domain-containing protein
MSLTTPKRKTPAGGLKAVEVRQSGVHGHGVFALRAVRAGQAIGRYAGKRYRPDESLETWDDQLTYLFALSDGSMIDGAQGGNATRHINHACEPNVEAIEGSNAAGDLVVHIHAARDLQAGEELFLDYSLDVDGADPAEYPCHCGSAQCRGTLAGVVAA